MFGPLHSKKTFVVRCKRCLRDVPSGTQEFPFQSVEVACPLCGERHRYRPSEVFLARPHTLVALQQREQKTLPAH